MEQPSADPVIDVVVPAWNSADTVGRTIDSVLAQDFGAFRLIVADDGSTDTTIDVVRAYDDERILLVEATHAGVCATRNRGAAAGNSPLLVFLDADDEALPGWLGKLAGEPDTPLTRCGATIRTGVASSRIEPGEGPLLAGIFAVRRDLFESLGGYDESLGFSENTDLGYRINRVLAASGSRAHVVDELLVRIHRDDAPRIIRYRREIQRDAAEHLLRAHTDLMTASEIGRHSAVAGVHNLALGEPARARPQLRTAVQQHPRDWHYRLRLAQTYLPKRTSGFLFRH